MRSSVKFDCERCPGYCCSHGRIGVSDHDIRRLAKHYGISARAARERFTYRYQAAGIDEQIMRHQKDSVYKSVCKLFDRETRKCSVYAARPNVCRKYPYGSRCGYYDFLAFERVHTDDEDYVPSH